MSKRDNREEPAETQENIEGKEGENKKKCWRHNFLAKPTANLAKFLQVKMMKLNLQCRISGRRTMMFDRPVVNP